MPLIAWLAVGIVAGLLATALTKKGYGLIGNVVVGMLGAIVGSWAVAAFRIQIPVSGLPRTILVAFIGATILLILLRVSRRRRRYAWSRKAPHDGVFLLRSALQRTPSSTFRLGPRNE